MRWVHAHFLKAHEQCYQKILQKACNSGHSRVDGSRAIFVPMTRKKEPGGWTSYQQVPRACKVQGRRGVLSSQDSGWRDFCRVTL